MKLIKKKNKKLKNKTTQVELGSLYEINKNIIENNVPILTSEELIEKINLASNFMLDQKNKYYMLLCNDKKDYTVFNLENKEETVEAATILVNECLLNRGEVKSIDLTPTEDALEIWLSIEKESFCYYFFSYDLGIIEC